MMEGIERNVVLGRLRSDRLTQDAHQLKNALDWKFGEDDTTTKRDHLRLAEYKAQRERTTYPISKWKLPSVWTTAPRTCFISMTHHE